MNTLFSAAPFKRFDLGSHVRLSAGGLPRLAQASIFSGLLNDIGVSDAQFESIIKDLPDDAKNFNRDQWNTCKQQGLTTTKGAECAAGVIAAAQAAASKTPTTTPSGVPRPASPASSFPTTTVLLGLAIAGGAAWYFGTKQTFVQDALAKKK